MAIRAVSVLRVYAEMLLTGLASYFAAASGAFATILYAGVNEVTMHPKRLLCLQHSIAAD